MSWFLLLLMAGCPDPTNTGDDDDVSGDDDDTTGDDDDATPERPAGCEDSFQDPSATQLIEGLDAVSALESEVWPGYLPRDGALVLYEDAAEGLCTILYRGGVVAYGHFEGDPVLLTPLFGYQLPWADSDGWAGPIGAASQQPGPWVDWLMDHGVDRAAIVPIFPEFSLSGLNLQQLSIHEVFHVSVQAGAWFGEPSHPWPTWDEQPTRSELAGCYVDPAAAEEQTALRDAVYSALLDDQDTACASFETFQERRQARRIATAAVQITAADGVTELGCADAEAILEIEEGVAEYAGWAPLFDAGLASTDDLGATLGATTIEPFYKFGAGQLLLARALDPDGFGALLQGIADSTSPAGGVEGAVAATLESVCP